MTFRYTAESVKLALEPHRDKFFASLAVGRQEGWKCDQRMADAWCLGQWLREEMTLLGVKDEDRRTQEWKFNRLCRTYELFESAAECMNDVLDNNVEQNRRGHRRWG